MCIRDRSHSARGIPRPWRRRGGRRNRSGALPRRASGGPGPRRHPTIECPRATHPTRAETIRRSSPAREARAAGSSDPRRSLRARRPRRGRRRRRRSEPGASRLSPRGADRGRVFGIRPGLPRRLRLPAHAPEPSLDDDEKNRDEKDRETRGREHSRDDDRPEDAPRGRARALRDPQRHAPEDEREGRHEDGAKAELRALKRGLDEVFALLELRFREFDDQDRVLGREADEDDEADLPVDVEVIVAKDESEKTAEDRDGHREKHAQGEGPTFVEGCEDEKDEDERETEDSPGRPGSLLLLVREIGPVVADLTRENLRGDLLERRHRLAGAVARGRASRDLRRAVEVESLRILGPRGLPDCRESRERHHASLRISHVKRADVLGLYAVRGVRLHEDAPLTAEAVELVDVGPAEKSLEALVDVGHGDALLERLVPVDVDEDLGDRGAKRAVHASDLGSLARGLEELLQVVVQELDGAARSILEPQGKAPGRPEAGNRRRHEPEYRSFGDLGAEAFVQAVDERLGVEAVLVALVPGLERHEIETVVRRRNEGQELSLIHI